MADDTQHIDPTEIIDTIRTPQGKLVLTVYADGSVLMEMWGRGGGRANINPKPEQVDRIKRALDKAKGEWD